MFPLCQEQDALITLLLTQYCIFHSLLTSKKQKRTHNEQRENSICFSLCIQTPDESPAKPSILFKCSLYVGVYIPSAVISFDRCFQQLIIRSTLYLCVWDIVFLGVVIQRNIANKRRVVCNKIHIVLRFPLFQLRTHKSNGFYLVDVIFRQSL